MPDTFTEVTRKGWGKNIMDSLVGVLIGIVLFFVSFIVLWTNEGRVNMSKVAKKSIPISSSSVDTINNGKLVSVSGVLSTSQTLGDPDYLKPGSYIILQRYVEMYAWEEESDSETKKKVGGGTETTTTYTYNQVWTSNPENSSGFRIPEGHYNPALAVQEKLFAVSDAKVGVYGIDARNISMPEGISVRLSGENVIVKKDVKLDTGYLYKGKGSMKSPEIGDVKISFTAMPNGTNLTIFGQLTGSNITKYMHKGKDRLYRAFKANREGAIQIMKTEHKVTTWLLRIVGFVMMWIGLTLCFGPINALLNVLPFLGSVSKFIISVAMFIVAFVLSIITIIVSIIAHSIIAMIILIVLIVGGVFLVQHLQQKKGAVKQAGVST